MVRESVIVATVAEEAGRPRAAVTRAWLLRLRFGAPFLVVGIGLGLGGCGSEQPRRTMLARDGGVTPEAPVGAAGQVTEPCNGLDDDRDGQVDEHCDCTEGATQPCYGGRWSLSGVGACVRGTQRCDRRLGDEEFAQWRWGACEGWLGPEGEERCGDAVDNDCNGTVNEDCGCAPGERAVCYPGPADTAGVGVCASGSRTCAVGAGGHSGGWGECHGAVTPAATDVCGDDLDNDCDGTADEGCICRLGQGEDCYDGPAEAAGVGVCKRGRRTCVAGAGGAGTVWSACSGAVTPAATETCRDQRDNNCDGVIDDGCGNQVRYADISDLAAPHTYVEMAIDPRDPATWYVVDFKGVVSRTTDAGESFHPRCRVAPRAIDTDARFGWRGRDHARLLVSPAADRSAYLMLDRKILRIDDLGRTVDCPTIREETANNGWRPPFAGSPFAIDPQSGELLSWRAERAGSPPGTLDRSADQGRTWRPVAATLTSDAYIGSLAVDPTDGRHLLAASVADTDSASIHETRDGGLSWRRRCSANFNYSLPAVRFDPRHQGWAYLNAGAGNSPWEDGFASSDGGTSWAPSAAHAMAGEWAINPDDGAGFRFRRSTSGSGIVLERAPDLRQPVWSAVHTFASDYDYGARVDAAGRIVLAIVGLRLWVSRDGGLSFSGPLGGSKPVVSGFSSIDSADGRTIYAVSPDWDVYRSADAGASFERVHRNGGGPAFWPWRPGYAALQVSRARPDQVMVYSTWESSWASIRTTDAFRTAEFDHGDVYPLNYARKRLALSATDSNVAFLFGLYSFVSANAGATWSRLTMPPGEFPDLGYIRSARGMPGSPYRVMITVSRLNGADGDPSSQAFLYDHETGTQSDLEPGLRDALGSTIPPVIEAVFSRGATSVVRVVGAQGQLAESTDGGRSFAAVPGAAGGLDECPARQLASLASNRDVLASWCGRGDLHTSRDGGRSWQAVWGPAWEALACIVTGCLVVAPDELVVTCVNPLGHPSPLLRISY